MLLFNPAYVYIITGMCGQSDHTAERNLCIMASEVKPPVITNIDNSGIGQMHPLHSTFIILDYDKTAVHELYM